MKILIVEDEKYLLELYQAKFEERGHKVILADNGKSVLKLAKDKKPDLVLLDIVMPDVDGYEVLKRLKKDSLVKKIPVIILSNLAQKEEIEKGLQLGADEYLVKTKYTPTELVRKVEEIWEKGKEEESSNKVQILLIEDEEVIIDLYRARLELEGFEVEVARNGAWGLKIAGEKPFDIILLDLVMPGMDGYKALKTLKVRAAKHIPVIVLSNSAQESEIKRALKLGAAAYLIKARITPKEMMEKVKEVLGCEL